MFACTNIDLLICFSYSSWSNQDYPVPNASTISWKSASFFVFSRKIHVESEMNGLDVVAEGCTYFQERKNLKLELKMRKEL